MAGAVASVVALLFLTCIGACSTDTGGSVGTTSAPLSTAAARAGSAGAEAAPADVATAYMRAVMDGDFSRAASYVVQEQQDFIKALALSTGPGTLLQMSGDIAIGNVTVTGDTATAVFVGRMCRTESGGSQQPQCVENNDAGTDSPIFTVHLRRVGSSNWQVTLPMPTQEN